MEQPNDPVLVLPFEAMSAIFLYLPLQDIFSSCALVCKAWNAFLCGNNFWQDLTILEFSADAATAYMQANAGNANCLRQLLTKECFQRRYRIFEEARRACTVPNCNFMHMNNDERHDNSLGAVIADLPSKAAQISRRPVWKYCYATIGFHSVVIGLTALFAMPHLPVLNFRFNLENIREAEPPSIKFLDNEPSLLIAKRLVKHGANINATVSEDGDTLLMLAAKRNATKSIAFLLTHGADLSLRSEEQARRIGFQPAYRCELLHLGELH